MAGKHAARPNGKQSTTPDRHAQPQAPTTDEITATRTLDQRCQRAVFLCQYFGCFRTGEVGLKTDDPELYARMLRMRNFTFIPAAKAVVISLTSEKAGRLGLRRSRVPIICNCPSLCAFHELRKYFHLRTRAGSGSPRDPAFQLTNGTVITDVQIRLWMHALVRQLNWNKHTHKPYSLRIGRASQLYYSGHNVITIQDIGRWQSDYFMRYVRTRTCDTLHRLQEARN